MTARTLEQHGRVDLDGERVRYKLIRVARRKNVHVLVDDDGELVVRAPWRFRLEAAEEAIREHQGWVVDTLRESRAVRRRRPRLVSGSRLPLLDEHLTLSVRLKAQLDLLPGAGFEPAANRGIELLENHAGVVYRRRQQLLVELHRMRQGTLRELLEAWYRREAGRWLPRRLEQLGERLGVRPAKVSIRAQKTRWGSCSSRGEISLNWRLVLLPSALADYILVHELCHLRYLDHSSRFWGLVQSLVPDYKCKQERIAALQPALAL